MTDTAPIYSSRITNSYLEFIRKNYPDLDVQSLLNSVGMTPYEVQDSAHWFTQKQADRFQEALIRFTGNPNIAREAGRYTTLYKGLGPAKQYLLGFMNPYSVYLLMVKLYPVMSRGATITVKRLAFNKVQIIATPKEGVQEKPYQCQNRIGTFESVGKLFTDDFSHVEHPQCFHSGDGFCRYIVSWKRRPSFIWNRVGNYFFLISLISALGLAFVLPLASWLLLAGVCSLTTLGLALVAERIEKRELAKTVKAQGDLAKNLIDEIDIRHNNALLVQKIGQATSSIVDIDELLETVMTHIEQVLDFDRGMIMRANAEKSRLCYSAGFGYADEIEHLLKRREFSLDNPESRGVFTVAFRTQKPILVNDLSEIETSLSPNSLAFARKIGVNSLICVPILYEHESLGILAVDNLRSRRPLTSSDMNFLLGVASQIAVGMVNALSFQKIQESEKKYRDLVENANSIIMRRELDGTIRFFNEYAQQVFGYKPDEIIGRNVIGTIFQGTEPVRRQLADLVDRLKETPDRPVVIESQSRLRDGESLWIAWTYKLILVDGDEDRPEILCIGTNITELKSAELEKRDLEAQLQRAQKMEAIGALAGGVAHDLNNILSGIISYPDLLLMDMPADSPLRKPILTIQKSGERAAAIVQDLLTLARRNVATMEPVNLNSIITDYLKSPEFENLKAYHPHVTLETDLDPDLLRMLGSPIHLTKTIMNLVTNGFEAIQATGKIEISTRNRYVDNYLNGYDKVREGDYVTLQVRDNGIGIPASDIERIFEPFYTKKVMGRSGTGLGMAVVWGAVKDHNGYIDVSSEEGYGTTFTLFFQASRKTQVDEGSELTARDIMGNGASLLVVDDIAEQREIAYEMLTRLGYSVTTVSSGEEAVAYMDTHSADLLILDMIMEPGIDGLDTYREILKRHPRQKAIITSGYSETERVKKAQRLGARTYVKKPYLAERIGSVIKAELQG